MPIWVIQAAAGRTLLSLRGYVREQAPNWDLADIKSIESFENRDAAREDPSSALVHSAGNESSPQPKPLEVDCMPINVAK